MNKHLFICVISLILVSIIISGCFESQSLSSEEQRFVGTWIMEGIESPIIFYPNGDINGFIGNEFKVEDGKFVILSRYAGGYIQEFYDYIFSDNDTRLILTNINTEVIHTLNKQ